MHALLVAFLEGKGREGDQLCTMRKKCGAHLSPYPAGIAAGLGPDSAFRLLHDAYFLAHTRRFLGRWDGGHTE